jgi:hypothetical protein
MHDARAILLPVGEALQGVRRDGTRCGIEFDQRRDAKLFTPPLTAPRLGEGNRRSLYLRATFHPGGEKNSGGTI